MASDARRDGGVPRPVRHRVWHAADVTSAERQFHGNAVYQRQIGGAALLHPDTGGDAIEAALENTGKTIKDTRIQFDKADKVIMG